MQVLGLSLLADVAFLGPEMARELHIEGASIRNEMIKDYATIHAQRLIKPCPCIGCPVYKRAAAAPATAMRRPPALADKAAAAPVLVGREVEVTVVEAASVSLADSVVVKAALLVEREAVEAVFEARALLP